MFAIMLFLVCALFVFMYHYERNGDPMPVGNTFERIMWGLSFGIGYAALNGMTDVWLAPVYAMGALAEIYVPHAAYQNMGYWPTPQKTWPGFFLKNITTWTPGSAAAIRHDFFGMMGVGFFRGAIVFLPPLLASIWLPVHVSVFGALLAWGVTMIGQSAAYLLGRYVPFSIWTNPPKSPQWGEFLIGIFWAFALAASLA